MLAFLKCISLEISNFCYFNNFCVWNIFSFFGSWPTSLLCIVGELAGGGSVAVAIGV